VFDCDMDVTSVADNFTVEVSTSGGSAPAESETFLLRETMSTSGLSAAFTGIISISTNNSFQGSGNGAIWTEALAWNGTVLTIKYNDTYSPNSSSFVIRTTLSSACSTPSMYISQTISGTTLTNTKFATDGGLLNILVNDGSQNKDAANVDTTSILAFTLPLTSSSDLENVILVETGVNTGTFTGRIGVSGSDNRTQGDLELSPLSPGDAVNFTYLGCVQSNISTTIQCVDRGAWMIDVRPVPISHGRNLTITISDQDLNSNPLLAETYSNLVALSFQGVNIQDSESIVIKERGVSSSIFTGTILISQGIAIQGNGIMEMDCTGLNRCNFSRTYYDANFGALTDTAASARRGIVQVNASKSALTDPNYFVIGESIDIVAYAGDASLVASVSIVGANNVVKTFVLSEIAPNSGIFKQMVQTNIASNTNIQQSSMVAAFDGQSIVVTFLDPFPVLNPSSASLIGQYPGVISIEPDPIILTRLQSNGSVSISLRENDVNVNASAIDVIYATLSTFSIYPLVPTSSSAASTSLVTSSTATSISTSTTAAFTTTVVPSTTSRNVSNFTAANNSIFNCSSLFSYLVSGTVQIALTETSINSGQFIGSYLVANASRIYPGLQDLQNFVAFEVCFPEMGASITMLPRLQRWVAVNSTSPIFPNLLLGGSLLQITVQDGDADQSWFAADSITVIFNYFPATQTHTNTLCFGDGI
jgi:hypothetical protein